MLQKKLNLENVTHILDDFMFIGPPSSIICQQYLTKFLDLASDVGIPIKHSKTVHPTTETIVHGIRINTVEMSMSLPDDKYASIKEKILCLYKRKNVLYKRYNRWWVHLTLHA